MTVLSIDLNQRPVAIGGVGGSGTRIVAAMLEKLGFFIGGDLNEANDNLWFTLFFKRSEILSASDEEFTRLVRIFISKMTNSVARDERLSRMLNALADRDRPQHTREWLNERVQSFLDRSTDTVGGTGRWGWKEPNTHIVIDRMRCCVPRLKYIHVIRNGMDMAFSANQNQLTVWGPTLLGKDFGMTPRHSLKFWCVAHRRILAVAKTMLPDFLLLNYDDMCRAPERSIAALLDFLDVKPAAQDMITDLTQLIRPPESLGRHRHHSRQTFDAEDLAYVRDLGFEVEGSP